MPVQGDDVPTTATIEVLCADYEHTLDLGGSFAGVEVRRRAATTREMFQLSLQRRPFEVAEFSISNYVMMRDRGADWLAALPIFPYRAFRHNIVHVRNDSPLAAVSALCGRTVGVPDYSMTAAVWARGIFSAEYGLEPTAIAWVSGLSQRFPTPAGVDLRLTGDDLEVLLERGDIDALLTPHLSHRAHAHGLFRRLLPGHPADERAAFLKTGIYPPNHLMVVNLDVVGDFDAIAEPVFAAFSASKTRAFDRRLGTSLVPWAGEHWASTLAMFGGDPLPYGLTPVNRRAIGDVVGYLAQQGLISRPLRLEDLFSPAAMRLSERPPRV